MPEISRFFGIIVLMFANEHPPPHFHARYGEYNVKIEIGSWIVEGRFPPRALRLLLEWAALNEESLLRNWDLLSEGRSPNKIMPLE